MTKKQPIALNDALDYYDVLRKIAKDYAPVEKITDANAAKQGLTREEMLEYAYDNIQQTAAAVIKGRRRPRV